MRVARQKESVRRCPNPGGRPLRPRPPPCTGLLVLLTGCAFAIQGRQWEESGEYGRAVDSYLKVDRTVTSNPATLAQAWGKAAELAVKFLDGDRAVEVAEIAGPRLIEVGRHAQAAQLYMGVEMIRYVTLHRRTD